MVVPELLVWFFCLFPTFSADKYKCCQCSWNIFFVPNFRDLLGHAKCVQVSFSSFLLPNASNMIHDPYFQMHAISAILLVGKVITLYLCNRMYSELISSSISSGGPFASKTSYVKLLRWDHVLMFCLSWFHAQKILAYQSLQWTGLLKGKLWSSLRHSWTRLKISRR